ncbi:hypothetical protein FGO68_gene5783 [Halteria grandinella]|uniref:Acyl-coenzyme A oxidase n=1 Tax=Halteria grandinella TaxID=5974 RepID=A0A8J8NTE5_HALGN|nr:hypothetical protein FGO68_gene5783 [Halteria grandinella]
MDKQEFADLIFGDNPQKRPKWFSLLEDPIFKPRYNIPLNDQRQDAYHKLKKVTDAKIMSVLDFGSDPTNIFTAHEFMGQVDPSAGTKMTVQFNLFGGSVFALSTERHRWLFPKIDDLSVVGCFCLTELGYGNNAVKMETTFVYDEATKEFIVNTPTTKSQKYWITNSVNHANYALVFGQTIVKGKNEGVNAVLVRIRDDKMDAMPGVRIVDMGIKMGLNGVDNGALFFKDVRVPREYLMNRYSDVSEGGVFKSETQNIPSRFFKVTERLLSGRLCIASLCMGATRACLYIGIKYAMQRLGVGASGLSDTPIYDYQLQQNALLPLLARSVSLNTAHNRIKSIFAHPIGKEHEVLMMCCIDKCLVVWNLNAVAVTCRERSGGQGFLACNRFGEYLNLAHAGMTAEGDNRVLMIKVVKDYMGNVGAKKSGLPKMGMCPKNQLPKVPNLVDLNVLLDLLKFREITLFKSLVATLDQRCKVEKANQFEVLQYEVSDNVQSLAQAYGERQALEFCLDQLHSTKNADTKKVFATIFTLFASDIVLRDLGFYLSHQVVSQDAAKAFINSLPTQVKALSFHTKDVIESLNVPVHAIYTPIVGDYVGYNQEPHFGEVVNAKL